MSSTTQALSSPLADSIRGFLDLRQSLGFGDKTLSRSLIEFDRFLARKGWTETFLTREIVEEWASGKGGLKAKTRAARLHVVRLLAKYHVHSEPQCYIPGRVWHRLEQSRFRPHIYSPAEIEAVLAEAARLTPRAKGSTRALMYVTLFSLISCTGLRISEALALELRDVDLEDGLLIIRESKFHKTRMVPLHPTATEGMQRYRRARDARGYSTAEDAPFFVNERGRPCMPFSARETFLRLARRAGLRGGRRTPGPRVHDLRHAFAVRRLLEWYRDGGDVQARLPRLSTYLGHVSIVSTQVYLDITAELLHEAARRFRAPHLSVCAEKGPTPCL